MYRNVKAAILIACLLIPALVLSQELNITIVDTNLNKDILFGNCDRSGLEKGDFGKLFSEYYQIYEPERSVLSKLRSKKDGVDILIILGTWCRDSEEQVPRFFKILDKIKFEKKNVQLICVDSNKDAGLPDIVNYNIQRVPTFIIYRRGREIGRIVETPYTTLEKDLLMFFSDN